MPQPTRLSDALNAQRPTDYAPKMTPGQKPKSLRDVIAEIKYNSAARIKYVSDWKESLPPGSRWMPGLPGRPDCQTCQGTGWVTLNVPMGHPYFGKALACDCQE